ncbi:MAG: Xaa-Pro aminopeptidase [Bradymonadaceae bacterium]
MYDMSPGEFEERRKRLMEAMGPEGVAIFVAPPMRSRSRDTTYVYRPSSDILYLSGFREMDTVLVLAPGHDEGEFVLFVPPKDPKMEQWEGRRAGPEGAVEIYGADAAYTIDDLNEKIPGYLEGRERLYYTLGEEGGFDAMVTNWLNKLRHRRNAPAAAPSSLIDARDLLHEMRIIKTEAELALMRTAAKLSSEAHILAMKHCRPGMYEYELQALIEYHFRRRGGEYPAYTSIVGGGANATILHYTENRDQLRDGELVLIDAGCEFEFYAGDITRTFPVSGKFNPAQKDVYQAVLDAQIACVADVEPGLRYNELQERTARRLTLSLIDLGLLKGSVDELVEEQKYKKYYPHNIGHWMGMDVHDVGPYHDVEGNWRELAPGMVLTIEPGIYIPHDDEDAPEELRGIGVRIEDDILVTAGGHENLTHDCPKTVDAIEALVGTASDL